MAGVRTDSIRREGGSQVVINFTLQTSLGHFPIELTTTGEGSMGDIEKIGLRELETMLTESLESVQQNPA
jgi:hypothetical protein